MSQRTPSARHSLLLPRAKRDIAFLSLIILCPHPSPFPSLDAPAPAACSRISDYTISHGFPWIKSLQLWPALLGKLTKGLPLCRLGQGEALCTMPVSWDLLVTLSGTSVFSFP
jgi:hypothetical protein